MTTRAAAIFGFACALPASMAHARADVAQLMGCNIYAHCAGLFAAECRDATQAARAIRSTDLSGGKRENLLWIETDYSRFPGSAKKETRAFLPVSLLSDDAWQEQLALQLDPTSARSVQAMPWVRANGEPEGLLAFDLHTIDATHQATRAKIACGVTRG